MPDFQSLFTLPQNPTLSLLTKRTIIFSEGEPILEIGAVTSRKGITAVIKNVGNTDSTVEYTIAIEGGLIITPRADSGDLGTIAPGDSETVTFGPMGIGLRTITAISKITVAEECTEGSSDETIRNSRIILFFVKIKKTNNPSLSSMIKVVAYDNDGNSAVDDIGVWKFL